MSFNPKVGFSQGQQITPNDIIDKIVAIDGLYDRIFGKLLDKLVYDRGLDDDIEMVDKIYGYSDIGHIVSRRVEWDRFKKLSQIIFRYTELNQPTNVLTGKDS